jgi:hypothetical protein
VLVALVAIACSSLCGLVVGTGGRRAPAAAFAVAAIAALALAPTGGGDVRAAPRVLAMKAPAGSVPSREANPTAPNRNDTAEPRDDTPAERVETAEGGVRNPTGRFRGDVSAGLEARVRAFYADLDAGRYAAAWRRLAPAVQRGFGGFSAWRTGYGTTVAHTVEELAVQRDAVTHTLVASCGAATGRYAVSWRFEGAKAVGVTAEALSGTAC